MRKRPNYEMQEIYDQSQVLNYILVNLEEMNESLKKLVELKQK